MIQSADRDTLASRTSSKYPFQAHPVHASPLPISHSDELFAKIPWHPDPVNALSDAAQQLESKKFRDVMESLKPLVELMGKHLE